MSAIVLPPNGEPIAALVNRNLPQSDAAHPGLDKLSGPPRTHPITTFTVVAKLTIATHDACASALAIAAGSAVAAISLRVRARFLARDEA